MIIFNDVSEPWQLGFQDSAAPTNGMSLHKLPLFAIVIITKINNYPLLC